MFVNIVYRLVNKLMRTQLNIAVEERLQTNEAKPKRRRASPTEITRQSGKTRIVREIGLMLGLVFFDCRWALLRNRAAKGESRNCGVI